MKNGMGSTLVLFVGGLSEVSGVSRLPQAAPWNSRQIHEQHAEQTKHLSTWQSPEALNEYHTATEFLGRVVEVAEQREVKIIGRYKGLPSTLDAEHLYMLANIPPRPRWNLKDTLPPLNSAQGFVTWQSLSTHPYIR